MLFQVTSPTAAITRQDVRALPVEVSCFQKALPDAFLGVRENLRLQTVKLADSFTRMEEKVSFRSLNWLEGLLSGLNGVGGIQLHFPADGLSLFQDGNVLKLRQIFQISAAHFLPHVGPNHKCHRLHGHDFFVEIWVQALSLSGEDALKELQDARKWVEETFQNRLLNEMDGLLNPTSEMFAVYLKKALSSRLSSLVFLEVHETPDASCRVHWEDRNLGVRRAFRFESAFEQDGLWFGHSFLLNLWQKLPMDPKAGWTMDYALIKSGFQPLLKRLDHRDFSRLEGQNLGNPALLADWIAQESRKVFPALSGLELKALDWSVTV